jgi:hypothetical protein
MKNIIIMFPSRLPLLWLLLFLQLLLLLSDRLIAQAVSRRLLNAATRVRDQVKLCGICDGQSGTWAGFLRVLRFSLTIFIHTHQLPSGAGTIGHTVADVPSGLSVTSPPEKTTIPFLTSSVYSHLQD